MNLSSNIKITFCEAGAGSGTTTLTGSSVDMSCFDGVIFVTNLATANAGNYLKAQQSSDNGVADAFADLEGSKVVCDEANQTLWLDVYRPQERYIQPVVVRGSATVSEAVFAIQYAGRKAEISNLVTGASGIKGELSISPAEGTA